MRYRVLTAMQLHPGALLGLTEEQAQARSFALVAEGPLWRVIKPVGFKAGELIEHEGDLPKAMASVVEPLAAQDEAAEPAQPAGEAVPRAAKSATRGASRKR